MSFYLTWACFCHNTSPSLLLAISAPIRSEISYIFQAGKLVDWIGSLWKHNIQKKARAWYICWHFIFVLVFVRLTNNCGTQMHKETFLKRAVNQCSRLMLHMMTISWLSTVFLLSETLFCMSSPIACFPLPQVPSSLVFSCNKALKYTAYTILFCFLTLSLVSSLPHICIFNTQNFKSGSNSLEVNIKPFNLLPQGESLLAAQI